MSQLEFQSKRLRALLPLSALCAALALLCAASQAQEARKDALGLQMSTDKAFCQGQGEICATIKLLAVDAELQGASLRVTAHQAEGGKPAFERNMKPLLLSTVKVPFAQMQDGRYSLEAELVSSSGERLAKAACEFRKIPPTREDSARLRIGKDGVPLLDGKPTLLRVVWLGGGWEGPIEKNELEAIARQGFDSVVVGPTYMRTEALAHYDKYPQKGKGGVRQLSERCKFKDFRQFLDALHEYGMTCFAHMGETCARFPSLKPEHLADAGDFIVNYRDDDAILGWYTLDETDAWLQTNKKLYDVIKQIDPYRPVWLNVISATAPNRDACDILSSDPYPVGKTNLSLVSNHADSGVSALRGLEGKTPWLILQMFGSPQEGWPRPPTSQEERCMSYLALNHGAKGLGYFAHQKIDTLEKSKRLTPELWRSMKNLNAETKEMSLPYLLGKDVKGVAADNAALDVAAKSYEGALYIIAVNASANELDASIKLDPLATEGDAVVKFEERKLPVENGTIADRFRPYEVHVYVLKEKERN